MATDLDLSQLTLMDALDLATLVEEEARQRYKMFAAQFGQTGSGYDAGTFFASMAENEAKHGAALRARRLELFGDVPMNVGLYDLYDLEAPDMGAPRHGMSAVQAFEIGLAAEQKAYDFFDQALPGITNPEVVALFTELRDEEAEHLQMLKDAMAKLPASADAEGEQDPDEIPYL